MFSYLYSSQMIIQVTKKKQDLNMYDLLPAFQNCSISYIKERSMFYFDSINFDAIHFFRCYFPSPIPNFSLSHLKCHTKFYVIKYRE